MAIVIPVFNHGMTIGRVLEDVRAVAATIPEVVQIIVVDDGCTDHTPVVLGSTNVTVLRHEANRGKGHALMTGFRHSAGLGFTHVATIDADGQHFAPDLEQLIAAAREHPEELVIGERDMDAAGGTVPAQQKGRDVSRFWLRVHTGTDIPDSQCGLRVYPLQQVLRGKYRFWRFDFETEVLARMAWGGVHVRSVPIRCIYFSGTQRVSHFRPIMDTLRGVRVNVFLVMRRLVPLPFKRIVSRAEETPLQLNKWWRLGTWREAAQKVLRAGSSNAELATAFALGIFVGLTPFYSMQTILAIYLARRLHLNPLAAVIGSQISIPPLVPVWWMLSYGVGTLLLHGHWIPANWAQVTRETVPALLLGNLLVAFGVAAAGLILARGFLSCVRAQSVAA